MESLPAELRQAVTSWLTPFEKAAYLCTHKGALSDMNSSQLEHLDMWKEIFVNEDWIQKARSNSLHPVLLGCGTDYMALVLAGDTVYDIIEGTCPDSLLPSLRSQSFSRTRMEVKFPGFTLNVVHIMEPGLAIDVPDPSRCLQNDRFGVNAIYYMDPSSKTHILEPHIVTSHLCVIELPCFNGHNVWVFKRRYTEPDTRQRKRPRVVLSKSRRVTSARKSLRAIKKPQIQSNHTENEWSDIWEP
ncbi:hypothetical protein EDB80DRAFT_693393 [Ilyonectria destructans]|nr:hypothetical protein EDB80DRAFT_693393 [Ilyonectria destructans]